MQAIDEKDQTILVQLIQDARTPLSHIAQSANLSVAATAQRISRLETQGIIKEYKLVLNHHAFPYDEFDIYYQFTSISETTLRSAMKQLRDSPYTTQVISTMGYSDIRVTILAQNVRHLQQLLRENEQSFSAHIRMRTILGVHRKYKSKAEHFLSALLGKPVSSKQKLGEVYSGAHATLDATDVTLLKALARNPRAQYTALAPSVKLTPEGVARRVKQLEERRVILGYKALIDGQRLGYQWAVLLLDVRHGSEKERQEIVSYAQSHAQVSGAAETVGTYTLSVTLFGKTLESIRHTELDFRSRFGDRINESVLLFILTSEKYPALAEGILSAKQS
jgi:Lrp/AsnC family transcriptional regulator, leucine-responsive regulatory protein